MIAMVTRMDGVNLDDRFKALLAELQEQIASLEIELDEKPEYGMGKGDPQVYEWEMRLARLEQMRSKEDELKTALERIHAGDYGFCEDCSQPINPERLEALPLATLCIECASRRE